MRWLLFDSLRQLLELSTGAIDLAPRLFTLRAVQLHRCAAQPPAGAIHDRPHHRQIAQQLGRRRRRRRGWYLPLRFQEQLGLFEKALADHRRAVAPGRIELSGFPRVPMVPGERRSHALAVFQADARRRHQVLHCQVRPDAALAHLLLDRFRQQLDQRQPPRHPARAAIKAARQFVQAIAEALLQFLKQPALLQRRLGFGQAERAVQQQRFGLAHRPHGRFHRVAAQLLERGDALVAVDNQVTLRLIGNGDHHDRRLLARGGQRGQQPPLPARLADPQMLQAPVELVKLQLHGSLSRPGSVWRRSQLVLRGGKGKCAGNPFEINPIRPELVLRGPND